MNSYSGGGDAAPRGAPLQGSHTRVMPGHEEQDIPIVLRFEEEGTLM